MLAEAPQQGLMTEMEAVERPYRDDAIPVAFAQVRQSANELHGRLKSLTGKHQSIPFAADARSPWGPGPGWSAECPQLM